MYENYRVLFVDDELYILNSLRRGLAEEEYLCSFASSGKEALEVISKEKIDVIVSDIKMPEMNGLDLLKRVAEISPLTVKLVLSGYTQLPQVLATINQVDIFKFITKPWMLDDLIQIVKKAIDYYIIQEENTNYKKALEAKNLSYKNILHRINLIVEDANQSRELLKLCGKSILDFVRQSCVEDHEIYQEVLRLQSDIFELFGEAVTTKRIDINSGEWIDQIADWIIESDSEAKIEKNYGEERKLKVNKQMFEAAIKTLQILFATEFDRNGFFSRITNAEQLEVAIIAPNAGPKDTENEQIKTSLDIKIEFMKELQPMLDRCQIQLLIAKLNGNLVLELTV